MIRLLGDRELAAGDSETPEVYAQGHAWRALGQLRATEAVEPLLDLFGQEEGDDGDDWVREEVPYILGQIGPSVVPAVGARLERGGQPAHNVSSYATALVEVARRFPETRGEVIAHLCRILETVFADDPTMNGFIIADLIELDAKEAWPTIEVAFAAGRVDDSVAGGADDVKWQLGLGPQPPPRRYDVLAPYGQQPGSPPSSQPARPGTNAKQRFNERMRKKKAEKKKRKKGR